MTIRLAYRPRLRGCFGVIVAFAPLCLSNLAYAQRAGENAISGAEDAFGTRVGNESIGLYDANNARGFSPVQAGNVRVEGLYYDQQPSLNERLVRGSAVRVGISAQSYAFPAPTGIADYRLRIPGDKQIISAVAVMGPYSTKGIEIDSQIPIVAGKFSIGLGISGNRAEDDAGVKSSAASGAVLARWRPGDNVDITGFYSRTENCHGRMQPQTLTGGPFEPRHPQKRTTFGQRWENGDCTDVNAGAIGRAVLPGDWSV